MIIGLGHTVITKPVTALPCIPTGRYLTCRTIPELATALGRQLVCRRVGLQQRRYRKGVKATLLVEDGMHSEIGLPGMSDETRADLWRRWRGGQLAQGAHLVIHSECECDVSVARGTVLGSVRVVREQSRRCQV